MSECKHDGRQAVDARGEGPRLVCHECGETLRALTNEEALDAIFPDRGATLDLIFSKPREPMTEARAREVLGDWVQGDNLDPWDDTVGYYAGHTTARLMGAEFTAEQLRAIAFWMERKGGGE